MLEDTILITCAKIQKLWKKTGKTSRTVKNLFIKIYMTWYEFTLYELWMIFWLAWYFSAKTSQSQADMIIWNNIHSCLMNVKTLTFSVFFQSIFSSVMSDQHAGTGFNSSLSSAILGIYHDVALPAQLFKSLKFGNGSRMPDENVVILELKYLQNKKW